MKIHILILISFLSGCTTINPYTDKPMPSAIGKTAGIYGVSGAAGGALIGALVDDPLVGALVGGATGAVIGGMVGYTKDRESQDILFKTAKVVKPEPQILAALHSDKTLENSPREIVFNSDKSEIKSEYFGILNEIAYFVRANESVRIIISGYGDPTGTTQSNLKLSHSRAESVLTFFEAMDIDISRIFATGLAAKDKTQKHKHYRAIITVLD